MSIPEPEFIDASDWQYLSWIGSGGTRAKRVLQDQKGKLWYFKCSERKAAKGNNPEKYYKYEFWSEVLAYRIGTSMGLNVLRYEVALHDGELGCISPLMINREKEQLVELGRYMTALNPDFDPEDRKTRSEYTFDAIVTTLDEFDLGIYLEIILKTIIFDALISNTDRHQENWAFICHSSTFVDNPLENQPNIWSSWVKRKLPNSVKNKIKRLINNKNVADLKIKNVIKMAPIYDSGSSLGRELNAEKVTKLIKDKNALEQYVESGKSEVHWEKIKISHFKIIENLTKSSYLQQIKKAAVFLKDYNEQSITMIVNNIDNCVPSNYHEFCLNDDLKKLMIKLLNLRAEKLLKIFQNV